MTEIGRMLGRNKSGVSRELKRNGNRDGSYHWWRGFSLYKYRRKASVRKPRLDDAELLAYVREHLGDKFRRTPACITARWKMEGADAKLSRNTILQCGQKRDVEKGVSDEDILRRGSKASKRHNTVTIKPGHTIHERPECVENRERPGDVEDDTVYGGAGKKGAMLTLVDRKSLFLYAAKTDSRSGDAIFEAFQRALGDTPINSITLNNGSEFARHRDISARHNAIVYFADPHAPWQRGSNENINGLLRWFFPKGTDFRKVTKEEVERVTVLINNRPRKRLGWLSPLEFLARLRCTSLDNVPEPPHGGWRKTPQGGCRQGGLPPIIN
jgi:IS30 family transposase